MGSGKEERVEKKTMVRILVLIKFADISVISTNNRTLGLALGETERGFIELTEQGREIYRIARDQNRRTGTGKGRGHKKLRC